MNEGLGGTTFSFEDPRNVLKAFMEENIWSFSAAKSIVEMEHMKSLLFNADGSKRTFEEFRNACLDAGYQFNVNYLRTEYNTANAAAQSAAQWAMFEKEGVQILQYKTVGDDRVRPAHEALDNFTAKRDDKIWGAIYPPNDWNCRCWVVPGKENEISNPLPQPLIDAIPPLFRRNVGNTKMIYDENLHPYFKIEKKTSAPSQLDAVKHYGMPSVEDLYKKYKWDAFIEATSKKEAVSWWDDHIASSSTKDKTGVNILVDEELKKKLIHDRPRWNIVPNLIDVLQDADEIWSVRTHGELRRIYIKYYETAPIVLEVNSDLRAWTMVEMKKKQQINEGQLNLLRKGSLIYRKHYSEFFKDRK